MFQSMIIFKRNNQNYSVTSVSINKLRLIKQFKTVNELLKIAYIEGFNDYISNTLPIQVIKKIKKSTK